jgi:hypothetical protein
LEIVVKQLVVVISFGRKKPLQPCLSSELPYIVASEPKTMSPPSILKKKGAPRTNPKSPPKQGGSESDSSQRHISLPSADRRSAFASAKSVFQNTKEGSIRDLTRVMGVKKQMSMRGIKFADNVEVNEIARMRESATDLCFYSENSISNFRYEAFMEDCGLDPADFD